MQFTASGDPEQLDCVDVATNTTSYLLVMKQNGLIKHHTVAMAPCPRKIWSRASSSSTR